MNKYILRGCPEILYKQISSAHGRLIVAPTFFSLGHPLKVI
jgi:hypothetical protein